MGIEQQLKSEDEIMRETIEILSKYGEVSLIGITTREQFFLRILNCIKNMEQIIAQAIHEREGLIKMTLELMEK